MGDTHSLVKHAAVDKHAYQLAFLISTFTVPLLRDLYRDFDGDMVEIIVLGEISIHNLSRFFDRTVNEVPERWLDDETVRQKFLRPCNALSISQATGIPRETVRRKVDQLIDKGWIMRDENRGLILKAKVGEGFTQTNAKLAVQLIGVADQLRALLRTHEMDADPQAMRSNVPKMGRK